jgi:ATP-dependent exoDNAse (exonuclease V) alpha subunit
VVFVEDAHKLSIKQMEELLRKVTERGGKICLLGNPQAVPLEGPQCLRPIASVLGEATLTKNFRAHGEAHDKALRALARGQTKEFLTSFAESGRLHIEKDERQAMQQMVSDWAKEGVRKPGENLLLCSTTKERAELNKLAQAEMKKARKLGRKKVKIGSDTIHKGDRVVCTSNWTGLGVENGSAGKVVRIGKRRITRDLFKGKQFLGRPRGLRAMLKYAEMVKRHSGVYVTVKLDSGKVVDIPLDYYQHIRLGYAETARDATETKNAFVLAGHSAINRETLSSLASRSCSETRIYMDRNVSGDKLSDLARKASRSQAKEMAHNILGGDHEHTLEIHR